MPTFFFFRWIGSVNPNALVRHTCINVNRVTRAHTCACVCLFYFLKAVLSCQSHRQEWRGAAETEEEVEENIAG